MVLNYRMLLLAIIVVVSECIVVISIGNYLENRSKKSRNVTWAKRPIVLHLLTEYKTPYEGENVSIYDIDCRQQGKIECVNNSYSIWMADVPVGIREIVLMVEETKKIVEIVDNQDHYHLTVPKPEIKILSELH